MQFHIKHPCDLRDIRIKPQKVFECGTEFILFVGYKYIVSVYGGFNASGNFAQVLVALLALLTIKRNKPFHVIARPQRKAHNFIEIAVNRVHIQRADKFSIFVKSLERFFYHFGRVYKIENICIDFAFASSVKPRKRLHRLNATQRFIHKHSMKFRLVESRLIFVRNYKHVIRIACEIIG